MSAALDTFQPEISSLKLPAAGSKTHSRTIKIGGCKEVAKVLNYPRCQSPTIVAHDQRVLSVVGKIQTHGLSELFSCHKDQKARGSRCQDLKRFLSTVYELPTLTNGSLTIHRNAERSRSIQAASAAISARISHFKQGVCSQGNGRAKSRLIGENIVLTCTWTLPSAPARWHPAFPI
jgi:hypothetical protein